jgi:hypothetical protein
MTILISKTNYYSETFLTWSQKLAKKGCCHCINISAKKKEKKALSQTKWPVKRSTHKHTNFHAKQKYFKHL